MRTHAICMQLNAMNIAHKSSSPLIAAADITLSASSTYTSIDCHRRRTIYQSSSIISHLAQHDLSRITCQRAPIIHHR